MQQVEIEAADEQLILVGVPHLLALLSNSSEPDEGHLQVDQLAEFCARKLPQISLKDYFARFRRIFHCSPLCSVLAFIYIERLVTTTKVKITPRHIHRLCFASWMVSVKYLEDDICTAEVFARIGGLRDGSLNRLEAKFVKLLNFNLFVSTEVLNSCLLRIRSSACKEIAKAADVPTNSFSPLLKKFKHIDKQGEIAHVSDSFSLGAVAPDTRRSNLSRESRFFQKYASRPQLTTKKDNESSTEGNLQNVDGGTSELEWEETECTSTFDFHSASRTFSSPTTFSEPSYSSYADASNVCSPVNDYSFDHLSVPLSTRYVGNTTVHQPE